MSLIVDLVNIGSAPGTPPAVVSHEPQILLTKYLDDRVLQINEALDVLVLDEEYEIIDTPASQDFIAIFLNVLTESQDQPKLKQLLESQAFSGYAEEFLLRSFKLDAFNKLPFAGIDFRNRSEVLNFAAQFFKEIFQENALNLVGALFLEGEGLDHILAILTLFESVGGKVDDFHQMLVEAAKRIKPENFKEKMQKYSEEQRQIVYDVAFFYDNFNIQKPAIRKVEANLYTINLLWVNAKYDEAQEFLTPGAELDFRKNIVVPVSIWSKKHPQKAINIWYDSKMTSAASVERSCILLEKEVISFTLKDVRKIAFVQQQEFVLDEGVPVYFRVDLLKAVIPSHILSTQEEQYCVMTDLDIKPLSVQKLFDERSLNYLDDLGFVLAKDRMNVYENSFMILSKHKLFMRAHRFVILTLGVRYATNLRWNGQKIDSQQIYATYPALLHYLLGLDGRFGKENPKVNLDQKYRFDIFRAAGGIHQRLRLEGATEKMPTLSSVVPLKSVSKPLLRFNFSLPK